MMKSSESENFTFSPIAIIFFQHFEFPQTQKNDVYLPLYILIFTFAFLWTIAAKNEYFYLRYGLIFNQITPISGPEAQE